MSDHRPDPDATALITAVAAIATAFAVVALLVHLLRYLGAL